jgi:hypothetical protein
MRGWGGMSGVRTPRPAAAALDPASVALPTTQSVDVTELVEAALGSS